MPRGTYERTPLDARFLSKIRQPIDSGCWEWAGCKDKDGYGLLWYTPTQNNIRATWVSFWLVNKRWPSGMLCHTCDNPGCVNPNHLFEGNAKINWDDMVRKGRGRYKGENNGKCCFPTEIVAMIITEYESLPRTQSGRIARPGRQKIMEKYGISSTHLYRLVKY